MKEKIKIAIKIAYAIDTMFNNNLAHGHLT